ncbi:17709_t:CDS:2, partial [Acaulospora morrowiae]
NLNECEDWVFRRLYSQEQMIMDFAYCVKLINPDVMMGFNDGGYDWPFVLKKAERLNLLRDFVSVMGGTKFKGSSISDAGYDIHENNINITAQDNVRVMYFRRLGTLMIDVMVSFRKMYPNSERNSLFHFLKMTNLEGKNEYNDISVFTLSATYRPLNKNISVNEFVNHMRKRDIGIEAGERFNYYIIRHPDKNAKIHQKMVLVKYFDDKKMKIDMKYYINTLIGTLARFINHYAQFQTNDVDYKKRDEISQKNAENFLRGHVAMIDDKMTIHDIRNFFIPAPTKRMILEQDGRDQEKRVRFE